ncbi:cell division protein ZipA [Luteimonas yindakuii]|uniref:Cell division protein ZipA n=1 Tax=Luteimonas yindakuii TaxID=2565782 RepID=A0A4Z1R5G0_9GAMM|nr:cell division protein ZipA [Luteimonas yindakuii]QCO67518.1 cell division protein ZipA [Luteimonas yindakuii]TKS53775.1 cell division protein ZipA [Luteimonas yindakuii]
MSDVWLMRIGILVAGAILLAAIWYFGTRPRQGGQGRRVRTDERNGERDRMEPTLGAQIEQELDAAGNGTDTAREPEELDLFDDAVGEPATPNAELGRRVSDDFDKIVTLYIAARAGEVLRGPDIVVAAEKAGLTYGHMNVFHRLVESHPERGPIFSVANIRKPGSFEMSEIQALETPAIAFFLTLPAPVSALDAWEKMLPTAQRMAELLEGVLLDEQRNALGRQRVAHIRDELRAYDRQNEAPPVTRSPRW